MPYINKSKTDDWKTPQGLYDKFMRAGYYDPCPFKASFDGLSIEWKEKNFINPPYSELRKWVNKAIEEAKKAVYACFSFLREPIQKLLNPFIILAVIFVLSLVGCTSTQEGPRLFLVCLLPF